MESGLKTATCASAPRVSDDYRPPALPLCLPLGGPRPYRTDGSDQRLTLSRTKPEDVHALLPIEARKQSQIPHAPAKYLLDARTKDRFRPSPPNPMKEGAMSPARGNYLHAISGVPGCFRKKPHGPSRLLLMQRQLPAPPPPEGRAPTGGPPSSPPSAGARPPIGPFRDCALASRANTRG